MHVNESRGFGAGAHLKAGIEWVVCILSYILEHTTPFSQHGISRKRAVVTAYVNVWLGLLNPSARLEVATLGQLLVYVIG